MLGAMRLVEIIKDRAPPSIVDTEAGRGRAGPRPTRLPLTPDPDTDQQDRPRPASRLVRGRFSL